MSYSRETLQAIVELEGAAPAQFKAFMDAMRVEAQKACDACIRSPLELLQVNQGRAQSLSTFIEHISNARTQVGKLKGN